MKKHNFKIKETLTYGHELLTGKQTKYEFVKQDIDVPSKQIIIDGVDVSGCPHYIDKDSSCSSQDCECIKCIHNECFYKDYKAKEQECETLASQLDFEVQKKECLEQECERWKSNFNGKVSAIAELLQQLKRTERELACKEQKCEELNEHSVGFARKCQNLELDVCHLKDKNYNLQRQLDQLKKQNDIMLNSLKKLQNKICSNTSQCKYFLMDVLKEVESGRQ